MSMIPSDPKREDSLVLVSKLFGASSAIAFVIKFGIQIAVPSFTTSAFDDKTLNIIAAIAIGLPSLIIALVLLDRTRKLP
jgi:hypothetical protein